MEHNFVTIRAKEKQLARMEKVDKLPPPPKEMRLLFSAMEATANEVVIAENLTFSYGGATGVPLLSHLSLLVRKGERCLILGKNGCGKSTLMKLLIGKLAPTGGRVRLGSNVVAGYYDQENRFLSESNSLFSELREAYPHKTDFELRQTLALFLFSGEDVEKPISSLSGGERARLTLAKLILKKVNLLIMDEPTNHLDITSREVLENALLAFPGTVVAVSHDRYFIDRIATRIIELSDTEQTGVISYPVGEAEGGYTAYLRMNEAKKTAAQGEKAQTSVAPTEEKNRYEREKEARRESQNAEKRKLRAAEKAKKLENELAELEAELYGSAASDYKRAAEIDLRRNEIESELLLLYEILL